MSHCGDRPTVSRTPSGRALATIPPCHIATTCRADAAGALCFWVPVISSPRSRIPIETPLSPEGNRHTRCVGSQVGVLFAGSEAGEIQQARPGEDNDAPTEHQVAGHG